MALDAYTKRFDDTIESIARKHKCMDDTLLYDVSVEQPFWHAYEFLETCHKSGITLQPEKVKFFQRETEFGFQLRWEDYLPTEDRLAAIRNFPKTEKPTITDIRSWYGLVNQLALFMATATVVEPFWELLRKSVGKKAYWDLQL